jgi:hypothetical protein
LIAIPFDIYTSFIASFSYMILDQPFGRVVVIHWDRIVQICSDSPQRFLVVVIVTGIMAISPIMLSYLIKDR